MPFQLSPGVNVTEIDLTTVIPAVATTDAAIGGVFKWGPVGKPSLVVSEDELAKVYHRPDNDNAETWFTAASFLAYSNRLHVSRAHHSFGDDVRKNVRATNGATYLIAYDQDLASSVSNGMTVAPIFTGIADGVTVVDVDPDDLVGTVADLATDIASNTTFTADGAFALEDGEKVTISGSGLPSNLSAGEYYIRDKTVTTVGVTTTTTFKLAANDPDGGAIVDIEAGTGAMTLTRTGDTRITMSAAYTGVTGSADYEFHDTKYSFNAIANTVAMDSDALLSQHIVKNEDTYSDATFDDNVMFVAKYPGALGNSLKVSVCDSEGAFSSNVTMGGVGTHALTINVGANTGTISATDQGALQSLLNNFTVGDVVKVGNTQIGFEYLEITKIPTAESGSETIEFDAPLTTSENINLTSGDLQRFWQYHGLVEGAPGRSDYVSQNGNTAANDELHVVVVDEDGKISGIPGTVLEVWQQLSRATDAKANDGGAIYYKEVLNQSSNWIWWANDRANAPSATAALVASATGDQPTNMSFALGKDISSEDDADIVGDILRAYDVFKSAEDIDISLVLCGKSMGVNDVTVPAYIIDNICERRRDCVAFLSPAKNDVVDNATDITEDVIDFRNNLGRSSSYAVLDSGYKYMYDKYNDVYRWIPLNGDTAGLCAYTDDERDPWWSPAGFNRGAIKNVVKLSWNPKKGERDLLYKNGINPVVNFPGQGIVLFGDKTLLSKPSAFDRINVRRLFIVLEKAIATASKFTLFEFNDEFTRASFVNLVTPFLRDVQGRRGIFDFAVICDETNNTGEIIDRNEFVGDIYIKPARSINFIQLNFVAVRTGVEFSEVIGQF
jgi:hypothetical protein